MSSQDIVLSNPILLQTIFRHLTPRDIKAVSLVSRWSYIYLIKERNKFLNFRSWKSVVDLRLFWKWAVVRMREEHFPSYFARLDRLRLISKIDIKSLSQDQVETALVKLAECEELKLTKLSLDWRDSSSAVLSRALVKVEEVVVRSTFSTREMAVKALEGLSATFVKCEELKTRKLDIRISTSSSEPDSDLPPPSVSPELLSAALVRLVELNIDFIMNSEQLETLSTKIANEKNMKLQILWLNRNCNLDQVSPGILSQAIIRLKEMPSAIGKNGLPWNLSSQQITFLLKTLQETEAGEVRLKYLNLWNLSLTDIPPDCLAEAAVKVKQMNIFRCRLTAEQSKALLTKIAGGGEKIIIQSLKIACNDLSSVPAYILVKTIEKLNKIVMKQTKLTEPQMTAILHKFVKKRTFRAKVVDDVYDLSSDQVLGLVSGDLLARALSLLRHVRLPREFSSDQVISILKRITEKKFTEEIVFECDLASVSSDLLSRAVINMKTIGFQQEARLSSDQAKALFDTMTGSSKLRSFTPYIQHADLTSVDPMVLSEVLVKLNRVCLKSTLLTSEQLQVFFLKIAETKNSKLKTLIIIGIDLSSIPGELLSKALLRLRYVILRKSSLTPEQVYGVYWNILLAQNIKLRTFSVGIINVWSIVTPNVLLEAESKMRSNL